MESAKMLNNNVWPLIEELNPEGKQLRKNDVPAMAEYIREMYPPTIWDFPDGHQEVGTAWGLALREFGHKPTEAEIEQWKALKNPGKPPHITNARETQRTIERGL